MATKTFKIGLSNADKQAMAQAIYERLLALTFPEYDTSATYSVGDFVVYNDQLYKCIGATSGAWDSTKWQLATLNDLLTDIEDAVQFVNDKANVDGNYPTMTVGVADQLSPYDDESGDDQDEPFSFQATGTGNGSQPDFSTGSIALMKEKRGNTVVVNQLVPDNQKSFTNANADTRDYFVCAIQLWNGDTYVANLYNNYNTSNGLYILLLEPNNSGNRIVFKHNGAVQDLILADFSCDIVAGQKYLAIFNVISNNPSVVGGLQTNNHSFIKLSQWFNGDIPQDLLDHPENFFRYYQGSLAYNEGELVNADGRYIKCIGRQQWDEEIEDGYYDATTGAEVSDSSYKRTKNPIKVIPNTQYYAKTNTYTLRVFFYDKDDNFISTNQNVVDATFTTPSNCVWVRFCGTNTAIVGKQITISLYYEGESGYDQYYPYEVLTNNDTGTETLRKAGSVCDIKLRDGTIKRNIGYVDLGSLTWYEGTGVSQDIKRYGTGVLASLIKPISSNQVMNANCVKFIGASADYGYNGLVKECITVNEVGNVSIYTDVVYADATAFKTAMSGVYLFYELAEPTTEQGTTFSENLVIDDFGSMDFQGTNGVPQGNLIFYPVDYKSFIDTLYNYTEGTPSNIALKSDLPTAPQTWAESLPGYDATKTQSLKNVNGTLTWVTEGE